jgi:hypothetical protein
LNFYPFLQRYIQPNQRDVRFVYSKDIFAAWARARSRLFVVANEAENSAERIHNMTHTKTTA